jgi:hypothetical protein
LLYRETTIFFQREGCISIFWKEHILLKASVY